MRKIQTNINVNVNIPYRKFIFEESFKKEKNAKCVRCRE